jgi:hypothetical protein
MSTDWRISNLLRETSAGLKEHAERTNRILENARKKFERDHTGTTAGVGIMLIVVAIALVLLDKATTFASVGTIVGGVLLLSALLLRHRSAETQVRYGQAMIELERERARFVQKSALLEHIWLHGLPEGTPLAQIQILLGDSSMIPADQTAKLSWKQLPKTDTTKQVDSHSSGESSALF